MRSTDYWAEVTRTECKRMCSRKQRLGQLLMEELLFEMLVQCLRSRGHRLLVDRSSWLANVGRRVGASTASSDPISNTSVAFSPGGKLMHWKFSKVSLSFSMPNCAVAESRCVGKWHVDDRLRW